MGLTGLAGLDRGKLLEINIDINFPLRNKQHCQFTLSTPTSKPNKTSKMSFSLYTISIPLFIRGLTNLSAILTKATTHAAETNTQQSTLLEARLAPDMYPLPAQIQRVSDTAKGVAVRLGGIDPVAMEDNETTFEELQARIAKTIEVLKGVGEDSMNGKEEAEIVLMKGFEFTGRDYLLHFALPNFYFHVTAAYAILRNAGVPVGKMDYLGRY